MTKILSAAIVAATVAFATTNAAVVPPAAAQTLTPTAKPVTPATLTTTDDKTGLTIRQSTDANGVLVVEVHDPHVSIRKRNLRTGSEVTLADSNATIVITIDDRGIGVSGLNGVQRLESLDQTAYQHQQTLMARSTTIKSARALLDQLDLRPATVAGSTLLLTRVLLGTLTGDASAVASYRASLSSFAAAHSSAPRLVRASFQDGAGKGGGPGECWGEYESYLLQIWNDFWDCIGHNLNSWLYYACEAKWLLQAELAMSWVIACSGGLPVR